MARSGRRDFLPAAVSIEMAAFSRSMPSRIRAAAFPRPAQWRRGNGLDGHAFRAHRLDFETVAASFFRDFFKGDDLARESSITRGMSMRCASIFPRGALPDAVRKARVRGPRVGPRSRALRRSLQ